MSKVHSLKVGIDFGTTYSGVAWADTNTPSDINIIQKWPSGGNKTTDKVPTELKYSREYRAPGYKWGFEVELEPEKLIWIKLLLDPSQPSFPDDLSAKARSLIPKEKEPLDAIIDYLSALKRHIMNVLEGHYGKAFIKSTKIEYFLTVPAIWSDAAKALTLHAAESVGLGAQDTLPLITEPEAAAVYSLKVVKHDLKITDTFVIADCGGGTVDLISYEITALKPELEVRECVSGTGGMCGSTFVNRAFEAWARTRMGVPKFIQQSEMSRMHMNKHFEEYLKRIFSDDESQDKFFCTVPGIQDSPAAGVKDGFLAITRTEMRALFNPVISKIVDLVQQQINSVEALDRRVSAVVLVGGFGASEYLRKRLSDVCDVKGIDLYNPENAWTAVARGACQRGLEGLSIVRSHIAKRSYGVLCVRTMSNGSGNLENTYICPVTKEIKIRNRVAWLIRKPKWDSNNSELMLDVKGAAITENKATSFPFVSAVPLDHCMIFENTLLGCMMPFITKNAKNRHVFTVCKLSTDLNVVPRHMFDDQKKVNEAGEPYYLIQFDLTIKLQAALVFSFVFKGKEYSSVKAKWS